MNRLVVAVLGGAVLALALSVSAQTLAILCEDDRPAQFREDSGVLSGYTVELVREIQKRVGNRDEIQMVPWSRGYELLQKKPNVVLFQMSRTAERNALFNWVGPVQESVFGLYARADSKITLSSLEEAKRVGRIGVYLNDVRHQILAQAGFTNLVTSDNNINNVKQLMQGRIDLYASSSISYGIDATTAGFKPSDLKLILPFRRQQAYIAMSRAMPPTVVDSWNAALDAMRKDGSMEKLLTRFFPQSTLPGPAIADY